MQSRPFMASDTNLTISDDEADLALSWSGHRDRVELRYVAG